MIGERIRNARKRAKLSQTELGKRAGYSMNGLAKVERGESDPKLSGLMRIADALDMKTHELLSPTEGRSPADEALNMIREALTSHLSDLREQYRQLGNENVAMSEQLEEQGKRLKALVEAIQANDTQPD